MSDLTPRRPTPPSPRESSGAGLPFEYVERADRRPGAGWGHPPQESGGPPDDTIELAEVLAILRRRIWLVLAFVVLGGAFAVVMHELRDDQFQATAVIRVEDPRGQMSERLGGLERMGTGTDPIRSALEVLSSRSVLGQIVDQEGLRLVAENGLPPSSVLAGVEVGEFALPDTLHLSFGNPGVQVRSSRIGETVDAGYGERVQVGEVAFRVDEPPTVSGARFILVERERAMSALERNLVSQPRPETNVVDVRFTASNPERAQRIVNRAVQVFQERATAEARADSQRRRLFLEEQLAQADTTLQMAQAELTAFRSQEQVVSGHEQGAAEQTGLMNIEMRREELRADRGMYQSILGELASAEPGEIGERIQAVVASPEVAQNPVVSALHTQLMEHESERQALTSGPWGLSDTNPDVARIDQQIVTTRGRLESAVRSHMDNLDARLAAMDDLRDRTASQIGSRPQALAQEERLMQDVSSIRRTVEQLQDEYQRARLAEAVEEGPVQIVDLAPRPRESQNAGLPLMLALGLMLGTMVGAGGAFVLEMLNTKVRREEDVENALRVGTVGVIPRLRTGRKTQLLSRGAGGSTGEATLGQTGNGAGPGGELVVLHDTRSAEAEAFRTLRTNLLFARDHDPIRAMVVTSTVPGEGKTTTASNLAVTYAQQGLRVLLVDADMRKPRVGELFGTSRKPGLSELVLGQAGLGECVRPFEAVEGLHILPSGTLPPNPTELLGGARARDVLRTLREHFDMVILDSPPLAGGADGAILGASVDGVVMVVRAGETEMDAVRHAGRQLYTVGANLIGAVMNDPDGEAEKYGTYYHSEYYGEMA